MDFDASCRQLGFSPASDGVWFGVIDGHVLALFGKNLARGHGGITYVEGAMQYEMVTPSLTVQVSHADPAPKRIEPSDVKCGSRIDALIASGKARCATEPHRSLLFIFDARFIESFDILNEVIHGFLSGLDSAGIPHRGHRCHWCGLREVPDCQFIEGRATRICEVCIEERRGRAKSSRPLSSAGAGIVIIAAVLAVIPAAIIAATLQLLYHATFSWITRGDDDAKLHVPSILLIVLLVGYAIAVSAPVALVISRIRERGDWLAACVAFISTLCASLLAEVIVVAWIVGNRTEWLRPAFIKQVFMFTWQFADFALAVRVFLAAFASFVASAWVRPKVRPFFD